LGGDVTGKLLIPIVVHDGTATYELGGERFELERSRLDAEMQRISNMGYYPIEADEGLAEELRSRDAYERRLLEESLARARRWVAHADEKLGDSGVSIFFAPGNDDDFSIDAAFEGSRVFVNAEQKVIELDSFEMITTGWSNPTPWETPRECSEDELEAKLRRLADRVRAPRRAIFNFHVPPHGTPLDICPQIDDEFRVVTVMGNPVQTHAGSAAVRKVIEEYQPLIALHGHIHESRNATKLGHTISVNPGSEYGEGVLMGVIVALKGDKAKYTFTAG
jgi:Icc-related predicted phosphoesterase